MWTHTETLWSKVRHTEPMFYQPAREPGTGAVLTTEGYTPRHRSGKPGRWVDLYNPNHEPRHRATPPWQHPLSFLDELHDFTKGTR